MGQVVGWDITIPMDKIDKIALMAKMTEYCAKWVFQGEQGEKTGYKHWQCRVHLHKKITKAGLLSDICPHFPGNWSITSNNTHKKNKFNYVMKAQTRIEGPYSDEDYTPPPPMTRQLKAFMAVEMYPWQKQLAELVEREDDRRITVILDEAGDAGKSIFAEYLEYKGLAFELPPLRTMEDLMQFAYGFAKQRCYLIDMPRAMKKDKLGDFYAGIECLKNGVCYDKRYAAKKRRFDRPQIVVFTNSPPKWELMSAGRWECFRMTPEKSLELLTFE